MTAQLFLVSVLGLLSGHRILSHLRTLRVISAETLARTRFFAPTLGILTMFTMRRHLFLMLGVLFCLHLVPFSLMIYNQWARKRAWREQILPFLDELVLKMRAGRSLREALKETQEVGFASVDLAEIPGLLCFPEEETRFSLLPEAREFLQELKKMDAARTRVIERVRAYRQKEKMLSRFRQRSSQVTDQVRTQAAVCSFLYIALLIWTIFSGSARISSPAVTFSLIFFGFGLLGMAFVARSFKWKL